MKKELLIFLLFASFVSLGQEFQFNYEQKELDDTESSTYQKHFLGSEFEQKMQLISESYTYKTKDDVSQIETVTIEKQAIYFSVRKINKYLKKGIKKGVISMDEAKQKFAKVLAVALNVRYQETGSFEEKLWSIKDPKEILELYVNQVELI